MEIGGNSLPFVSPSAATRSSAMSIRSGTWLICELILASFWLCATPAYSDPIVITTGQVTLVSPIQGQGPPFGLFLTAPSLSFQSAFFDIAGIAGQAGGVMNLSGGIAIQNPPFQTSSVTVNGTTYNAIYPGGALTFTATPFSLGPGSDLAPFQFSTPFTMKGDLTGFTDSRRLTPPLFDVAVTANGVATVTGQIHGNGTDAIYLGRIVSYAFSPASATPEPSSWALCGIGACMIFWRRTSRRKPNTFVTRNLRI
jgi:hypothetical protein